jgi:transcriptional regulator with XRE-family HTH domain
MKTGKTQQQIAAFLGVNDARISRYLKGHERGCISQSQLLMLCDYLGIDVQLNISVNNV